jgi:hypothetical protein
LSVGEALVAARIRAGLTTEEVSARSLIRESVVAAMERDDYEACGGPVYVNGYIRAVAAAIGVDPLPLIAQYASVQRSSAAPRPEAPSAPEAVSASEAASVPEAATVPETQPIPEPVPELEPFPEAEPIPEAEPGEPDPDPAQAQETQPEPETESAPEPEPTQEPAEFLGPEPAQIPIAETTLDDLFGYVEPEAVTDDLPSPVVPVTMPSPAATPPNGIPRVPADPPTPRPADAGTPPPARKPRPRPSRLHPEEPRPVRTRERRRLWVALGSTVVLLVVVGVATTQLVSHANHAQRSDATAATQRTTKATSPQPTHAATQPSTTQPATTPAATKAAAPPVTTLTPAAAAAFGPAGTADGDNPNIASQAIDNSTSTDWQSNWYATAAFGDLKSGTGLLADMGSQVTIDQVTILLGAESGATLELKTGDSLSSLSTRATATNAGGKVTLKVKTTARYVLFWFTQLPPDGDGTYQISVYNITCKGYRT